MIQPVMVSITFLSTVLGSHNFQFPIHLQDIITLFVGIN